MKKIYISGPITGMPDGNKKAFYEAEEALKKEDGVYYVANPHEFCKTLESVYDSPSWENYMDYCIVFAKDSDEMYMLRGWEKSRGARLEHQIAKSYGIPIRYQSMPVNKRYVAAGSALVIAFIALLTALLPMVETEKPVAQVTELPRPGIMHVSDDGRSIMLNTVNVMADAHLIEWTEADVSYSMYQISWQREGFGKPGYCEVPTLQEAIQVMEGLRWKGL